MHLTGFSKEVYQQIIYSMYPKERESLQRKKCSFNHSIAAMMNVKVILLQKLAF